MACPHVPFRVFGRLSCKWGPFLTNLDEDHILATEFEHGRQHILDVKNATVTALSESSVCEYWSYRYTILPFGSYTFQPSLSPTSFLQFGQLDLHTGKKTETGEFPLTNYVGYLKNEHMLLFWDHLSHVNFVDFSVPESNVSDLDVQTIYPANDNLFLQATTYHDKKDGQDVLVVLQAAEYDPFWKMEIRMYNVSLEENWILRDTFPIDLYMDPYFGILVVDSHILLVYENDEVEGFDLQQKGKRVLRITFPDNIRSICAIPRSTTCVVYVCSNPVIYHFTV